MPGPVTHSTVTDMTAEIHGLRQDVTDVKRKNKRDRLIIILLAVMVAVTSIMGVLFYWRISTVANQNNQLAKKTQASLEILQNATGKNAQESQQQIVNGLAEQIAQKVVEKLSIIAQTQHSSSGTITPSQIVVNVPPQTTTGTTTPTNSTPVTVITPPPAPAPEPPPAPSPPPILCLNGSLAVNGVCLTPSGSLVAAVALPVQRVINTALPLG